MPRVRIKQLDERVATSGVHLGGDGRRRKLCPGEVVEIPEGDLFDAVWKTGKLELTMDPVTRPLDFATEREARLTSPTFKSRGPDDDREIAEAWAHVEARMSEPAVEPEETQPEPAASSAPAGNRRAKRRRAAKRAATNGKEATA